MTRRRTDPSIAAQFGQWVRARRKQMRMTAKEVGDLADVSGSTVHYIETGQAAGLTIMSAIADALGAELVLSLQDKGQGEPKATPDNASEAEVPCQGDE